MAVVKGPQNPTPTSTSVRAGNRLTRISQLHYIPRYRIQLGVDLGVTRPNVIRPDFDLECRQVDLSRRL